MMPVPVDFPKDEVGYLLPLLRGQAPASYRMAVHCGCVVVDYGAGLIVPGAVAAAAQPTECECADHLETAAKSADGFVFAPVAALPWAAIIQVLVPLILQWLQKHPPTA